jgi:hypothetical protein
LAIPKNEESTGRYMVYIYNGYGVGNSSLSKTI